MPSPFDDPFDLNSTAKKILDQERLRRESLQALGNPDQFIRSLQTIQQHTTLEKTLMGLGGVQGIHDHMSRAVEAQRVFTAAFPPDRLRALRSGFVQNAVLTAAAGRDLAHLAHTIGAHQDLFARLKSFPDMSALAIAGAARRTEDLHAAFEVGSRLDVAWASASTPSFSVGALAELRGFTARIRSTAPTVDERVVEVAEQFGEYDLAFATAEEAPTEDAREAVYTDAGRNATLVAFPPRAYASVLVAAGWVHDYLPPPAPLMEGGGVCTSAVHDPADAATITAVESHLRHFVDSTLTARSDASWVRTYVAADRLEGWRFRQAASVSKGNPALALIYYADFQDLLDIMARRDLWRDVFGVVFGPKPLFEATMTRLHAIRIEIGHARPLTNTTRLRLEVEANAVFKALGVLRG